MLKLLNVPEKACPVPSEKGELRLMAYEKPGHVALYAYFPHGSMLPVVEKGLHISHTLRKLAARPETEPWRTKLLKAAEKLLADPR